MTSPHKWTGWWLDHEFTPVCVTFFLQHTSASLMLCENADPQVRTDLESIYESLGAGWGCHFRPCGRRCR